jgi:transitional endoplasmic reticulum ATPase
LQLYVQYRSGVTVTVGLPHEIGAGVGNVVLVSDDEVTVAPDEVWPRESWVGVVRKCLGETALVAGRGDVKVVATNGVECREGNTVEVDDFGEIMTTLADHPITYLDRSDLDEPDISRFKGVRSEEELTFDDFGGLEKVKRRARELVELPLEHHDALARIKARPIKGVLFTGLPGTGKTMLARIIASVAKAEFYEISGPQIFSKWVGESEAVLRRIFEDAAEQERSIIFFDEIDSVAPQRASDANEASRRVVAQLLTQMDGFKPEHNVVVIAATNRADDLDEALRRPGRFDWEVEFPLPDVVDRAEILRVSSADLRTVEGLPHDEIARRTEGWSSAALSAIWSEAALLAVADGRDLIMDDDYYGGFERVGEHRRRVAAETDTGALQ